MHSKITNRENTVRILRIVSLICVAAILFCSLALVATAMLASVGGVLGLGILIGVMYPIGKSIPPSAIPTVQIYMPRFLIEMRLNAEFRPGMSKADVAEKIRQTDWFSSSPQFNDRGVYIDQYGNATYYYEDASSFLGDSSVFAFVGEAPIVICIAYFAFDENDELIKVKVYQDIAIY